MAIFSPATDLQTRQLLWVPRNTQTNIQQSFAGQISAHESWFFSACYRDKFADDVVNPTL